MSLKPLRVPSSILLLQADLASLRSPSRNICTFGSVFFPSLSKGDAHDDPAGLSPRLGCPTYLPDTRWSLALQDRTLLYPNTDQQVFQVCYRARLGNSMSR